MTDIQISLPFSLCGTMATKADKTFGKNRKNFESRDRPCIWENKSKKLLNSSLIWLISRKHININSIYCKRLWHHMQTPNHYVRARVQATMRRKWRKINNSIHTLSLWLCLFSFLLVAVVVACCCWLLMFIWLCLSIRLRRWMLTEFIVARLIYMHTQALL